MKKIFLVSLMLALGCNAWAQDKNSTFTQIVVTDHGHIIKVRYADRQPMHRLMELNVASRQMAAATKTFTG